MRRAAVLHPELVKKYPLEHLSPTKSPQGIQRSCASNVLSSSVWLIEVSTDSETLSLDPKWQPTRACKQLEDALDALCLGVPEDEFVINSGHTTHVKNQFL